MKHTPGPWHRHGLHVHASYEDGNGNRRHYAVADALQHSGLATGEADANARLIAAAPELLEACKDVEWVCRHVPAWNGNDGGVLIKAQLSRRMIHALRAAIKKAKGEE